MRKEFLTSTRPNEVSVIKGRIVSVDPVRHVCTVVSEIGGEHRDIPIMPTYLNSKGGGNFHMPETDSIVWLMRPSTQKSYTILGSAALPMASSEDTSQEEGASLAQDFRMNRPVLNEGDQVVCSQDGNYIIIRRGGVIEIGASQTAQTIYIPLNNVMRSLCENYEVVTTGGSLKFNGRRTDETDATKSPVEFRLDVKEFAQEDPTITVGLGRIAEENSEQTIDGPVGGIVARIIINDRFRYWIDREGNAQSYTHGSSTHTVMGLESHYNHTSYKHQVRELFSQLIARRSTVISQNDTLQVGRDREVTIAGNYKESVSGSVLREVGHTTEIITGKEDRSIHGDSVENILGGARQTIVKDKMTSVAGNVEEIVAGTKNESIAGGLNPLVPAYKITLAGLGTFQIHNTAGKIRMTTGGLDSDVALGALEIKPSGTLHYKTAGGVVSLEINATGIQLKTAAGTISVDQAGTVDLGLPGRGYVVTTLTHPVDYVTGAPILGASSVRAGGLPLPGPAAIPSTFISDPS